MMEPILNNQNSYLNMDLLRFTTAGSVDDGKSTLIGRLLYDSKSIFEDQMEAIEQTSLNGGDAEVNLALLTDGLKAEREQKITIDVAYRYFATPKRKFIIADTPGHVQYTSNMVTGASTADLAVILVDAQKGLLTQSKRHAFISSLLQIPNLVVAINKMDLVDFDQNVYEKIVNDFKAFARKLDVNNITYIPISALKGDNVVEKSVSTDWYQGTTLLHHLENVKVDTALNVIDFRLPVQYVIRPDQNFRGFAGRVASGRIRQGDEVMALPSRLTSKVKEIVTRDGNLDEAEPGDSVVITIEDEIDISRGDMLVRINNVPAIASKFEAYLCWMNAEPLVTGKPYLLMHTSRTTQVYIDDILYSMNVDTLHRNDADTLRLNEIGRVSLTTSQELFYDPYKINQKTGSFIIIDPASNVTVGGGMIRAVNTKSKDPDLQSKSRQSSPNTTWEPWNIGRKQREERNGHKAAVLWFTGISGAGKTTIAKALETKLYEQNHQTMLLDGDQVRHGLNGDLGFSPRDRAENIRRVGEVAHLFFEQGNIVLCTFVSPYRKDRELVKSLFPEGRFIEVQVECDKEAVLKRDPKGLYAKAEKGEIKNLTGFNMKHETSDKPDIVIDTTNSDIVTSVDNIYSFLKDML
ncbi:MAG: sulfate adenylyltransferase subunit CysN [Balneolales bacterium]